MEWNRADILPKNMKILRILEAKQSDFKLIIMTLQKRQLFKKVFKTPCSLTTTWDMHLCSNLPIMFDKAIHDRQTTSQCSGELPLRTKGQSQERSKDVKLRCESNLEVIAKQRLLSSVHWIVPQKCTCLKHPVYCRFIYTTWLYSRREWLDWHTI